MYSREYPNNLNISVGCGTREDRDCYYVPLIACVFFLWAGGLLAVWLLLFAAYLKRPMSIHIIGSGRVASGGVRNLTGLVESGQEVFEYHWWGQVTLTRSDPREVVRPVKTHDFVFH